MDCLDNSNNWYQSTIVDRRIQKSEDDRDLLQICIGFRLYDPHGDQVEYPSDRRFYGWPSRYDEWLCLTSPRIQPKETVIRGTQTRYKSLDSDMIFDDSNDLIYKGLYCKEDPLFAVTRHQYRSIFLMKVLNRFGRQGGFDRILDRFRDRSRFCNIDILMLHLEILNNINPMFYREFAIDFIGQLKDAVIRNVLESPNNNLRNLAKEKIDFVVKMLQELLKRAFPISMQLEIVEKFSLDISFLCFNSDFLERKLQGLKAIMEIMKDVKYRLKKFESLLDVEVLCRWLNEKQIFEGLYGRDSHAQLIQRSGDFLKFIINEDFFTLENLALIWDSLRKGNVEERLAIYKALSSVSIHFKPDHIEFLVQKLKELPLEQFIKEDIDLLYDITKYQSGASTIEIYEKAIIENEKITGEIAEIMLQKFVEVLKGWDMEKKRYKVLQDLIKNIDEDVSSAIAMNLFKKVRIALF